MVPFELANDGMTSYEDAMCQSSFLVNIEYDTWKIDI